MNRSVLAGTSLVLSLLVGQLSAQDSVLTEVYGQGVHAYYSRDYQQAHELLSSAIEQGSRDPRCYYFRGLAYGALGRPDEAEADFQRGAQLETGVLDRILPISDSLQRVQGRWRLEIEKHRQAARLASHIKASQIQQTRYEELKRNEQAVLRDPSRAAAPAPAAAAPAAAPAEGAGAPAAPAEAAGPAPLPMAEANDPFAGNAEVMPEKSPEKPAEPTVDPAVPAGPDDPFGSSKPAPAATPSPAPGATPAADDAKVDPFADDKPAGGQSTPPPAPPPAPPSAEKPANDDPFK